MTDVLYRGRENIEGLKKSFFSAINILPIIDPQYTFGQKCIANHRCLILFSVNNIGSDFKTCSLKKVSIPINMSK
jgi:hypothetical protein